MTSVIPVLGLLTTGRLWPFLYLRRSIREFMPPERVLEHLRAAGFSQPKADSLQGGIVRLTHALRP
jgi:ubiquinone/menaquinone biosynthesis C-methylase UbiE